MNYKFEDEREMLLLGYTYYDFLAYRDKLKKRFFKIVELVIFDMLKTDYFFGQITVQMGRETQIEKKERVTLGINIDEFQLIFNPILFLQLDFEGMKKEIIHEILHLFFQHPTEYQKFKNRFSNSALSQALDKDLEDKKNGIDNNSLEEMAGKYQSKEEQNEQGKEENSEKESNLGQRNLEENLSKKRETLENSQEFKDFPQEMQEKIKNRLNEERNQKFPLEKENYEDFHSGWEKNGEFDPRTINKAFYKIVENVLEKDRGLMPVYLDGYFQKLLSGKGELKWQQILKRELGKLPVPYKKTITRKDRRQPKRLDLKGRLPKYICKIFVAIDTSGSMGEKELEYAFNEIFGIIKHSEYKLSVIECDAIIEKIYEVKRKKDVQFKVRGRGGTAFQPVFDYLQKRRERDYLLIYFTDGYGEKSLREKPKNGRVLWVITGGSPKNLSLEKPYGQVRGLDYKK